MSERTLGNDMRRISNSEVSTWLACERKYYYEFDLSLEPVKMGGALGRGIIMHDVLAEYYLGLQDGMAHDNAVVRARKKLQTYADQDFQAVMEIDSMLIRYWAFYRGDAHWEILSVESGHDLALTTDFEYALRLDLLVRDRKTHETILVDHKSCYDFWTQDDLDLNPQFPKYIGALRANGIYVDKAILNQIRTRAIKSPSTDQLFRRTECTPSKAKVANALREQIVASQQIVAHRNLPLEVRGANSLRTLNKQVCKYCNVKNLCLSEYDGADISVAIQTDYKSRTYGYNEPTANVLDEM